MSVSIALNGCEFEDSSATRDDAPKKSLFSQLIDATTKTPAPPTASLFGFTHSNVDCIDHDVFKKVDD